MNSILNTIEIPQQIQHINSKIFYSSTNTLREILNKWPNILIALGIIIIGWLIMKFVRWTIVKISSKIFLHKFSEKSGLTKFLERAQVKSSPSEVIAKFLGGYIFMMFFLASSNILGLTDISEFLNKVINYIPQVVVALFIVLIGFQIGNTVSAIVESTLKIMDSSSSKIIGLVAKEIIVTFAILAALFQLNIAEDLVKILFTGVVSMIVLAGGLSIGLGSKDFIKEFLFEVKKKHK